MTTPQDAETAAREALSPAQQFARRIIQEICWEGLDADGGSLQDLAVEMGLLRPVADLYEFTDALRPASSPGEVTVTEAMVEAAANTLILYGEFSTRPGHNLEQARIASRAALTAALRSTTQTEAGNGR